MKIFERKRLFILTTILTLLGTTVHADDISRGIREGKSAATSDDGGFLELGLGFGLYDYPIEGLSEDSKGAFIGLVLNGRYQWRGLFVEAITECERGLTLGYNIGGGESWLVDIIGSNEHDEISEDIDDDLQGLRDRKLDFMLGLRSTLYRGNYIGQLELVGDVSNRHKGVLASASFGRYWQLRNWNLHSIFSIRHRSAKVVDYYLGIRPEEANERYPAYKAGAGNQMSLEFGLTYPLNEKWILRSTAQYYYISGELNRSPLALDNDGATWLTSFTRVF